MSVQTSVSERVLSIPNTHYMTLIGVAMFASAYGFQVTGMDVEAGLTATLGIFFVALGLISYGIFWFLGWIETR